MKVEIIVVTHKPIDYQLPLNCRKIQVNCDKTGEQWEGYYHDNDGENISEKNENYCELTALYWAWKNLNTDIVGLCHYRRFFTGRTEPLYHLFDLATEKSLKDIGIKNEEILEYLKDRDIIVGMPHAPYPNSAYTILCNYCEEKDIATLREVIVEKYSDYLDSYDYVMQSKNISYFNMMICKKEYCNRYCKWLFDVLSDVENRCDLSGYDTQRKRLFGYLAEILLNVYIHKEKSTVKYVRIARLLSQIDDISTFDYLKTQGYQGIISICRKIGLSKVMDYIYKIGRRELYERYLVCLEKLKGN